PGQALCRLPVVVLPARPIHQMALLPAPRRKSVGERIAGIGLEHQPEQTQRLLVVFRGFGKRRWYRAAGQIVDVLARLRLAPGAPDLGAAQHRTDRADQTFGDLVLQIERVFERAVEALVPQMFSARHLDKLAADANPIAGLSETPLDHIADPELAGELLGICPLTLVAETRVAGDDREPPCSRQLGDQVFGDAIEKELRLGVTAEVLERQDHQPRPFRPCRGFLTDLRRRRRRRPVDHDAESADRARDVLDVVLTQIFEGDRQPVADLVAYRAADVDPAGLRQTLQPRGGVDPLAVNQVAIGDDIAHGDRDPKLNTPVVRHLFSVLRHFALHFDRAGHGIDDAVELDQQAIAHAAHDAAFVRHDCRIEEIAPDGVERRQGTLLVDPHQAGIADDIGAHDDRKAMFYPGIAHLAAVYLRRIVGRTS